MKLCSMVLGLSAALLAVGLPAQERKPVGAPTLARLGWLAGSWRSEKAGRVIDEQWMTASGGAMLGMARTVAKGKEIEHEFLQIREGPGGELFYIALPSRQQEAAFKLVAQTDTETVFENKEHDFPQTIGYRLKADGSLLAWIEGPKEDGSTRRIEYVYQRAR